MNSVEPLGEALLEELHEVAQVIHLGPQVLAQFLDDLFLTGGAEPLDDLSGTGCW